MSYNLLCVLKQNLPFAPLVKLCYDTLIFCLFDIDTLSRMITSLWGLLSIYWHMRTDLIRRTLFAIPMVAGTLTGFYPITHLTAEHVNLPNYIYPSIIIR